MGSLVENPLAVKHLDNRPYINRIDCLSIMEIDQQLISWQIKSENWPLSNLLICNWKNWLFLICFSSLQFAPFVLIHKQSTYRDLWLVHFIFKGRNRGLIWQKLVVRMQCRFINLRHGSFLIRLRQDIICMRVRPPLAVAFNG